MFKTYTMEFVKTAVMSLTYNFNTLKIFWNLLSKLDTEQTTWQKFKQYVCNVENILINVRSFVRVFASTWNLMLSKIEGDLIKLNEYTIFATVFHKRKL